MGRTDLLDAALRYAANDWPVFPLAPRSKRPLISAERSGHGLHDATTDHDQVRRWWLRHPECNIGLRTGVAFDVVDVDRRQAMKALDDEQARRDSPVPLHGPLVATARGYHSYVLPTGSGNRAGFLPHVDYRGHGGYVVAPPSVGPSGHVYSWINPPGAAISPASLLAPAPAWLVDLLSPQREGTVNSCKELTVSSAYGRAALRRELERLSQAEDGTRNHSLNVAAYKLGRLVSVGALDEAETVTELMRVAVQLGHHNERGWLRECERTVASGLSAGIEQPRRLATGLT